MGTHVDDIIWTAHGEGEKIMQKLLDAFNVRKIEESKYRTGQGF